MLLRTKGHRQQKPLHGSVEIDWTHPLALSLRDCVLFTEGGGLVARNLARLRADAAPSGAFTWDVGARGLAMRANGDGTGVSVPFTDGTYVGDFTVRTIYQPHSLESFSAVVDKQQAGGREWSTFLGTNGNVSWFETFGTATNVVDIGPAPGLRTTDLVITRDTGEVTFYFDGRAYGGSSNHFGAVTEDEPFYYGNNPSGGTAFDGLYFLVQRWNRALSSLEVLALHDEPYAMLRPMVRRQYVFVHADVAPQQYVRPIEDIAAGNWTTFGGPTDHFDGLSDEDDATGSRSGETSSTLEVKLAPILPPVPGPVQYRVRYRKTPP